MIMYHPSCSRMGRTTPPDGYMQARTCAFTDMRYIRQPFSSLRDSYTAGFYDVFLPDHAFGHQKRLPLRCRSLDKSRLLGYHVRNYTVKLFEDAVWFRRLLQNFMFVRASKDGQRSERQLTTLTVFLFCLHLDYYICGISSTLSLRDG